MVHNQLEDRGGIPQEQKEQNGNYNFSMFLTSKIDDIYEEKHLIDVEEHGISNFNTFLNSTIDDVYEEKKLIIPKLRNGSFHLVSY